MSTKPTVCLAMIVKNESAIIKRCLDSAKPFINGYFIIDTGSTDNTKEIIAEELADFPGTIVDEEWVNFEHNRTSLVKQARLAGYDYMLLGDADMVFDGDLGDLTEKGYLIRLAGGFEYHMPYLVHSDLNWYYKGVTHEFLGSEEPVLFQKHPTFIIHHLADGGTRPEKYERDRKLLEQEFEKDPSSDRTTFYLAQTCRDMGDTERALELYRHRVELGGWDEEVYCAMMSVADLTKDLDDYHRAWCFRPSRPEAVERLTRLYNEKSLHLSAFSIAAVYMTMNPKPTEDILFVERWAYDYGIELQMAVSEFWINEKKDSKERFESLLTRELPDNVRQLVEHNLTFF